MTDKKNTDDLVSMFMNFGKDMKLPSPTSRPLSSATRKICRRSIPRPRPRGSGASEIMARQRAMVQEALEEISAMAETVKGGGGPQSLMTAQAEFARRSFEAAIKNTSEIAGIAQKSSTEAFKVLQQNMQETLEEARRAMTQTKK
ncbi:TIGR01841 family phasin [Hoeflea alexandrii]|uniref:TIGR01841 family phasin n=1 Tax=Hoeflea alexandrii TaxID=288436 RepID=UPI0022707955|nr:TIGR01841 family phasin [Hoeflea alexandrii]MCY0153985.1 TIGR01841 family phasin [Hoeflea alexandrii]